MTEVLDAYLGQADRAAEDLARFRDLVLCENSADGLRGLAAELEHAAEPLTAAHVAVSE